MTSSMQARTGLRPEWFRPSKNEKIFGEMAKHEGTFVHCGLAHRQLEDFSIEVGQVSYVAGLHPISEVGRLGLAENGLKLTSEEVFNAEKTCSGTLSGC